MAHPYRLVSPHWSRRATASALSDSDTGGPCGMTHVEHRARPNCRESPRTTVPFPADGLPPGQAGGLLGRAVGDVTAVTAGLIGLAA